MFQVSVAEEKDNREKKNIAEVEDQSMENAQKKENERNNTWNWLIYVVFIVLLLKFYWKKKNFCGHFRNWNSFGKVTYFLPTFLLYAA